ncbi:MAG: AI-2E family transporter [Azospirillaceae bacterium]
MASRPPSEPREGDSGPSIYERQIRFWLLVLVFTLVMVWLLSSILLPFVAGMAIAYVLHPSVDRLQRRLPRWLATTIILIAFILVFVVFMVLLVPLVVSQVGALMEALPDYATVLATRVEPMIEWLRETLGEDDFRRLRETASSYAGEAVSFFATIMGGLWRGGVAIFNLLTLLFIMPVVAFYLLRDWNRIIAKVDSFLPRRNRATIRALAREVDQTLAGFIRGQGLVCIILGSFYAIALTVVGLDFGLVIGLIAGILTFIPYVGSLVGLVTSVGVALVQFDGLVWPGIILAIFLFGQAVEGNFLTPKLVGDSVGLHAVWVIFALMAGGALFGFTGVLIAVPMAAVIGVLIRFALRKYKDSPYFDDEESDAA